MKGAEQDMRTHILGAQRERLSGTLALPHFTLSLLLLTSIAIATGFMVAGCGNANLEPLSDEPEPLSVGVVYDVVGTGDLSYNDSAASGIERASTELGIQFTGTVPSSDGSDREEHLRLASRTNDVVIGVGSLFESGAVKVAQENPETIFAVVDSPMTDPASGKPYGQNMTGLTFAEHEGSFLVGVAAALTSTTNKIGFIGGVASMGKGLIEKFQAGYEAGAKAVNPSIEVFTRYITAAPDLTGFADSSRAKDIALSMYAGHETNDENEMNNEIGDSTKPGRNKVDVIYHAAGASGLGLFQAAKQHSETTSSKVWAIGVDSDQYHLVEEELQEYVLTSMVKRVDSSVFNFIESVINGTVQPGQVVNDLSSDGVGYSTSGGFVSAIVDEIEDYKNKIVSGAIVVPDKPE